jgi:hypothetical protein
LLRKAEAAAEAAISQAPEAAKTEADTKGAVAKKGAAKA